MIRKFLSYFFILALMAGFVACSNEHDPAPVVDKGEILLKLKVDFGLGSVASRADDHSGHYETEPGRDPENHDHRPDGYEASQGEAEKISTLRVIILNYDTIDADKNIVERRVEGARLVRTSDVGVPLHDNLDFPVAANDKKTVVLIANETSIPKSPNRNMTASQWLDNYFSAQKDAQGNDRVVTDQTWDALMKWSVTMSDSQPSLFTTLGDDGNYYQDPIPLTETFELSTVNNDRDNDDARITQSANLFMTRAACKVTYKIICDDTEEASVPEGAVITGLRLERLQASEYLFPNDARYYLPKYNPDGTVRDENNSWTINAAGDTLAANFNAGTRRITGFERYDCPSDFTLTTTFLRDAIPLKKYTVDNAPAVGPLYFPESMQPAYQDHFTVSVQLNGGEWLTSQPLVTNILWSETETQKRDAIARSTHLEVRIFFGPSGITASVQVVPYVPVVLNPSFGF